MPKRNEPIVEHTIVSNTTNGDTHSIARIAIKSWLWPIRFVTHDDWSLRRGMQPQLLRQRSKRTQYLTHLIELHRAHEFHTHRHQMAVDHVNAMTLSAR